jgi:hypothetical protein
MVYGLAIVLVGAGMFALGWVARDRHGPTHAILEARSFTRWRCPQCVREKELPDDLDARVMICNNCQVRLVRF